MNSTERFTQCADAYAAHRPSYPVEAIDALLSGMGAPQSLTIADLGAGTGIASQLLADRGARVLAVEPNASMRAAAALHRNVTWLDGTAEETGLPDACVDVVAAFQAFHWFATTRAMSEMRRIARRRAALAQYERNEKDSFTRAYGDVVRRYVLDDTEALRMRALDVFATFPSARIARAEFPTVQTLDRSGLLGRAASASYLPQSGEAAGAMRADLTALFERFSRDGVVALNMRTFVILANFAATSRA